MTFIFRVKGGGGGLEADVGKSASNSTVFHALILLSLLISSVNFQSAEMVVFVDFVLGGERICQSSHSSVVRSPTL